jgi:DNA-binding transcriptional LysR family regulator
MVNLEWYRTFVAIYEKKTLTKAAKRLYASQPGVSVHLNALESYTGKKLFKRTSRSIVPTEEGKQLYDYIIDSIQKLEKAEQHFKKTSQNLKSAVNIGMCTETFQSILEPEVPKLNFNLVAKFGEHSNLINDLNNGILDLIITAKTIQNTGFISYEGFSEENIWLVAGNRTKISSIQSLIETKKFLGLENALKKEIWYSASNEMEHFRRFWFDNFKKRPDFNPNFILPNIGSIIRCLENNVGFAVIPDFLVKEAIASKKIILIWQGVKKVSNTLYFATRNDLQVKAETEQVKAIFRKKMPTIKQSKT